MTFTELYQTALPYVVSILPSLAAVIGIIASIIKIAKDNKKVIEPIVTKFNELRQEVKDKTEMTDLKATINNLIKENAELRKENHEIITQLSKVKYYESNNKEV